MQTTYTAVYTTNQDSENLKVLMHNIFISLKIDKKILAVANLGLCMQQIS